MSQRHQAASSEPSLLAYKVKTLMTHFALASAVLF